MGGIQRWVGQDERRTAHERHKRRNRRKGNAMWDTIEKVAGKGAKGRSWRKNKGEWDKYKTLGQLEVGIDGFQGGGTVD